MERRLAEIPTEEWNDVRVDITPREYVLSFPPFPSSLFSSVPFYISHFSFFLLLFPPALVCLFLLFPSLFFSPLLLFWFALFLPPPLSLLSSAAPLARPPLLRVRRGFSSVPRVLSCSLAPVPAGAPCRRPSPPAWLRAVPPVRLRAARSGAAARPLPRPVASVALCVVRPVPFGRSPSPPPRAPLVLPRGVPPSLPLPLAPVGSSSAAGSAAPRSGLARRAPLRARCALSSRVVRGPSVAPRALPVAPVARSAAPVAAAALRRVSRLLCSALPPLVLVWSAAARPRASGARVLVRARVVGSRASASVARLRERPRRRASRPVASYLSLPVGSAPARRTAARSRASSAHREGASQPPPRRSLPPHSSSHTKFLSLPTSLPLTLSTPQPPSPSPTLHPILRLFLQASSPSSLPPPPHPPPHSPHPLSSLTPSLNSQRLLLPSNFFQARCSYVAINMVVDLFSLPAGWRRPPASQHPPSRIAVVSLEACRSATPI